MKIEYSTRSLADLRKIASETRNAFGDKVAAAFEDRIQAAIRQIGQTPESAPKVELRAGVRVIPLVRYPYRIFYRIREDTVRILHIRHTSRRPW